MDNRKIGWGRVLLLFAAVMLLGGGLVLGCAESKLDEEIKSRESAAALKDKSAGDAATVKALVDRVLAEARVAAAGPDGTIDPAKEYAEIQKGLAAHPTIARDVALGVAAGKTPDAAASALAAQAAADAQKFAAEAAAERAAAVELEKQRAAARAQDESLVSGGVGFVSRAADLWMPGLGSILGAGVLFGIQKLSRRTYKDGQVDGGAQAAQGTATLRQLSPQLDSAFHNLGGTVLAAAKLAMSAGMDDHVAAAVAANKDKPLPEAAPLISDVAKDARAAAIGYPPGVPRPA